MARSLAGISFSAKLSATLQNAIDGSAYSSSIALGETISSSSQTSGTGANQHDRFWSDTARTITSGGSEDIDMYDLASIDVGAGAGKDALGQAMAMVEITGLLIRNAAASVGTLLVGGKAAATAWNSLFNGDDDAVLVLPPGALFLFACASDPALAVADTSNHLLKLAASGGDVTYNIHFMGRSA